MRQTKEIGVTGFEPATSWSQTTRSTKLSYTPENRLPHSTGASEAHSNFDGATCRRGDRSGGWPASARRKAYVAGPASATFRDIAKVDSKACSIAQNDIGERSLALELASRRRCDFASLFGQRTSARRRYVQKRKVQYRHFHDPRPACRSSESRLSGLASILSTCRSCSVFIFGSGSARRSICIAI